VISTNNRAAASDRRLMNQDYRRLGSLDYSTAIECFVMGMSTHIVGFRPADERWKKMKAAYEACEMAGIAVPKDVEEFFGYEPPGDKPGMEVEIEDSEAVSEWSDESRSGYEIDVAKLPKDIAVIRVYNSW